jgi:tetratricopeptide (TPR) repeat protein
MSLASQFLVYVTAFRLAIIAAGVVSMILGYRLFIRGIYPLSAGDSTIDLKAAGTGFTLKNVAPGSCFGIFGVALITVMLVQGNPQFTYEMMQKTATTDAPAMSAKLEMRGAETRDAFSALVEKGMAYEQAGDPSHAAEAYRQALAGLAAPMNQLAWIYFQQSKAEQALPLARMAAQIDPENPVIMDTLAEVLAQHGDRAEAVQWMEKAADLDGRYRGKLNQLKQAAH